MERDSGSPALSPHPPTRRNFLRSAACILPGIVQTSAKIVGLGSLYEFCHNYAEQREAFLLRKSIFTPDEHARSQIVLATDNPWEKDQTKDKPTYITSKLCRAFIAGTEKIVEQSSTRIALRASSVILGSPTSNSFYRDTFQYQKEKTLGPIAGLKRVRHPPF